jgi:DNA repair exonuclease SbcCD nuclease subunit
VNIREQDHYDAAFAAVDALKADGVDVIIDLGDMAEVPAPKKRAIVNLIELVRFAEVPYYSVDGNHTSLKSSSDIHIYEVLGNECSNFKGFRGPAYDPYTKVSFVPHSYDNDAIREYIEESLHRDAEFLVGHWAADDIPYVGQVHRRDLPESVPVFLGHYHNFKPSSNHSPTYVGSTEKTAWDQWDYPTGVSIFDSGLAEYRRIEIPTRPWVNLEAGLEDYMDVLENSDITDKIARLTVYASPEEYNLVSRNQVRSFIREVNPTMFTIRRKSVAAPTIDRPDTVSTSLTDLWADYIKQANIPKGVTRKRIREIGIQALNG